MGTCPKQAEEFSKKFPARIDFRFLFAIVGRIARQGPPRLSITGAAPALRLGSAASLFRPADRIGLIGWGRSCSWAPHRPLHDEAAADLSTGSAPLPPTNTLPRVCAKPRPQPRAGGTVHRLASCGLTPSRMQSHAIGIEGFPASFASPRLPRPADPHQPALPHPLSVRFRVSSLCFLRVLNGII
jgi:hypothetical protein